MTECQRHNAILNRLPRQEQISVADVIAVFNISPTTTLRDINKPNEIGKLRQARNSAEAT
ncbi:DeoR family transcriptional regulator [Serratia symbiotica]|uniref:DeoR family transcriptional regulator n=1 Tax=Serratia symbiotica TaxID=138074 RepID=UPI00031103DA|nr:DeoR family transcriptional regulator [Serratia symbiotica]